MRSAAQTRPERLRAFVEQEARAAGFDVVAVASPDSTPAAPARLAYFLKEGRHGTMAWMEETAMRRAHPRALWPDVRSVIMLGMNYGPAEDPLAVLRQKDRAAISVYARNRDYHDVIKGRLKTIAAKFAARSGEDVKVFVDTAPVMEKPLAEAAGLGVIIEAAALPCHPGAAALAAARGESAAAFALSAAEDYELAFVVPGRRTYRFEAAARRDRNVPVTRVGRFTAEPGASVEWPDGSITELPRGFAHF